MLTILKLDDLCLTHICSLASFPSASPVCLQRLLLMVHKECATEDKLEISDSIEANAVRQCISEGITSKIDSRF